MTAPAPNTALPKSRRRWLSFSLRTLLIFVTLAGCGFGWLGLKFQEARRQAAAVAAIETLGGRVEYDYEYDARSNYELNATPPGPTWLRSLLGDDFFRNVYSVNLGGWLASSRQDRPHFDANLEFVKGLMTLKSLDLDNTQVSDAGLEHLKGLTGLEELDLGYTQVTDTGLDYLKGLTRLRNLNLFGTQVTDAGLDYLKGLTQLRNLILYSTQVSDVEVANLKGLTRLEDLDLGYSHVSDAGLDYLKGLTQLKHLRLYGTQVTDGGVAKLQQALPNCNIFWH